MSDVVKRVSPQTGQVGNALSLAAIAVDHLGGGAFTFLVLLFLSRVHGLDFAVAGAVITVASLLSYVFIAPVGRLVSFLGGRRSLLVACVLGAGGYSCYLWDDAPLSVVATGAFLVACNERLTATSWPMLAVERLGRQRLSLIFGLANTIKTVALASGALAASLILTRYGDSGLVWALALNVTSFGIAAVLLLLVRDQPAPAQQRRRARRGHGTRDALNNVPFRRLVMSQLALSGCWIIPVIAFPVHLTENLGQSAALASALVAVRYGLVSLLQMPAVRWVKHWSRNRILTAAITCAVSGLIAVSMLTLFPRNSVPFIATTAVVLIAMSEIISKPTASASAVEMAPPGSESSYLAVFQITWSFAYAVGPGMVGLGMKSPPLFWCFLGALLAIGLCAGRQRSAEAVPAATT